MNGNLNKKNKKGGGIPNINETFAVKIKDSRIYKKNDREVFIMNDNLISKNLQDLGSHINKYYNQNSKLNRKV